ncbi:MAG TPA: NAD(+)/NADH kinase [Pseudonocardia sp.]|nr:NAD(+)/NADH kinase [Pseudonocardia sp.]
MTIECIGVVVHHGKQAALSAAEVVWDWARRSGRNCVELDVWDKPETDLDSIPDLIVTVGGDGTFLRGVRAGAGSAGTCGSLVLGIDVGRVGFLTEVTVADIPTALDAVCRGDYQVDERMVLTARASRPLIVPPEVDAVIRYSRGPLYPPRHARPAPAESNGSGVLLNFAALNDIVFEKLARDRQASLAVYVMGRRFASYSADALIVSTPTGSTAYNFAAGGPILSPSMDALVFTPVAPHMIFDRSLVLGGDQEVALRVLEQSGPVTVSVDGQLRGVIEAGDWVSVFAGPNRARLVRMKDTDFLARVRERFGLTDAAAALADGSAPENLDAGAPPGQS